MEKEVPMVGIRDVGEHLNRRCPWNRGFSSAALHDYEDLIRIRAKQLAGRLAEERGEVILGKWFDYFACALRDSSEIHIRSHRVPDRYDLMYDIV